MTLDEAEPARLMWNQDGFLPPGDHPMTMATLASSVLVSGDGSSPRWDPDWRAQLVKNLGVLVKQLVQVGIEEIYVDGSFCSDKDRPGVIDGYFITNFHLWKIRHPKLVSIDNVWDLQQSAAPDRQGKLKPLMWHRYYIELFPVFREPFANFSASSGGNPPITIDKFFRRSRDGTARGVVRVLAERDPS